MKEVFFFIGLDFRTVSTFEQAGLFVFNACRISCLGILITNYDSGLRGKSSGVRFLSSEHKNGNKNNSTHAYMLMLMSRPSSLAHKLLVLMLVLMLASLVRTRL